MGQCRVIVGNHNADAERSEDEETSESPVHSLEGSLDGYARVHGLTSNHGDIFGTTDGPGGDKQGTKEAFESAQRAFGDIFSKSPRITPIPEAIGVTLRVSADHSDEGEQEQDDDENDLAGRQPEFGLSIPTHCEDVDDPVEEDRYETDSPDGDVISPKF